ncbi:MAG: FGGY-family carbohydrate kinase [Breznakia sp.]
MDKGKGFVISIDQSTQGTKAILLSEKGNVLLRCDRAHKQITNEKGWVSHDPLEIYDNVLAVVKELIEKSKINTEKIGAVAISNQRETSLIWHKKSGEIIDNAIVWQCARAKTITNRIQDQNTFDYVKEATGIHVSPYFPAAKFAWLFETHQLDDAMAKGELCCGTMDSYLVYRLTNKKVFKTDYANASRTQLFNIRDLKWDKKLCKLFHMNPACLPEVCDSDSLFGWTDFDGILKKKVPIHAVLGDSHAALFGQNCLKKGETKATYGTGSSIMMNTGVDMQRSKQGLTTSIAWKINNVVNYVIEGNINYTGSVITWLQEDMKLIKSPMETEILAARANEEDTTYLVPAFSGLGAPYWENDANAMFTGMTRLTGKRELVKAALDSIAYQINDVIEIMKNESKLDLVRLCVDGGPTANQYLMQFQSDISNIPIYISNQEELSAIGVGYLAGMQMGLYDADILKNIAYKRIYTKMNQEIREKKIFGWKKSVQLAITAVNNTQGGV